MGYIRDEMIKPILIGGVIGGVLSSIPIISCLNCCCLLYILSGAITAYLMSKEFDPSDTEYLVAGALSGGIAGVINWLLGMLINILIYGVMVPFIGEYYPTELHMEMMGAMNSSLVISMLYIPLYIIIGAIFGSIGGLLYEKLGNK
ncbi:hypothetical protein KKP89_00745 [Methanothermococcus sp. SCGC AD-155-N22]|nr:hypothetical protein [Methanothermococcus sp. SCGC AD-155-N22]